jgi:peroxiredoxin
MANLLTGDFEAAVQFATRQINGLLGTLHQNGAIESAVLKLLHSASLRIGDAPRRRPDFDILQDWLIEYQRARPGRGLRDVRAQLTAAAPPGAAKLLSDAFAGLDDIPVLEIPPDVIRGLAKVQVSTVSLSVPGGSSTEVVVQARLRAHYYPDQGTTDLPAPIHGDLRATFEVRRVQAGSVPRLLIKLSSDDSKTQFTGVPGSGLDAVEASRIGAEIRKAIRQSITMAPVDLPANFPFRDFKGLGSGQVLALPFQLSGAPAPASGAQGLNHSFVGSSGFAFAASKEHVIGRIDLEAIRQSIRQRSITITVNLLLGSISVTYRLRFSQGPTMTFKSGGIEISGRVEVETSNSVAPNGFVEFTQTVNLVLNAAGQPRLVRVGGPDVDESWFIPHGRAVNIVRSEIDAALSANNPGVRQMVTDGTDMLRRGLRTFDSAATVSLTGVEITPDGIIFRGDIGGGTRRAPVVRIAETHQGQAFTAFQSWIPAGRIDRLIWSWVEYSGLHASAFSGTEKSLTEHHRFILPKPPGVTNVSQICLRIEGTQVLPSGQEVSVSGGTTCRLPEFEFTVDSPPWWKPVTLPIWRPDLAPGAPLRDGIAGHVSVQTGTPTAQSPSTNTLVYFADWRAEKPLDALNRALDRVQSPSLMVIVVLPNGAFDSSRREFEARIGSPSRSGGPAIQFTEDHEGGWSGMFAVGKNPSAYLINAKREFVWKYEGELEPAVLMEALARHAPPPARSLPRRALELAVAPGDPAKDAMFEDDLGNQFALHRFQGRDMLLNFWQPWSAPCLAELSRLQRLHQSGKDTAFIVAFHGGTDSSAVNQVRKQLGLTFPLVHDSHQRIARLYGVRCWPTTVLVDAEGRVQQVQFGKEHSHGQAAGHEPPKQAEASA